MLVVAAAGCFCLFRLLLWFVFVVDCCCWLFLSAVVVMFAVGVVAFVVEVVVMVVCGKQYVCGCLCVGVCVVYEYAGVCGSSSCFVDGEVVSPRRHLQISKAIQLHATTAGTTEDGGSSGGLGMERGVFLAEHGTYDLHASTDLTPLLSQVNRTDNRFQAYAGTWWMIPDLAAMRRHT